MVNPKSIAVIGECMLELSAPNGLQSQPNIDCNLSYGGDTLNSCVYLSRLGVDVHYVTGLGDDTLSQWMVGQWRAEGVQCDMVQHLPESVPGMYLIELDDAGERSFKYWRKGSPASRLFDDVERRDSLFRSLSGFDYVYLSGISLAILAEDARNSLIEYLGQYRARGGKVIFDGNYRPNLWRSVDETVQAYTQVYQVTDIALPTFDDEKALYQYEDVDSAIEVLLSHGVSELVLKLGEEGCRFVSNGASSLVPVAKVEVVDTTSAGDSFNAGFLAGLIGGADIERACQMGHILAATVIQHKGAIIPRDLMPSFEQFDD